MDVPALIELLRAKLAPTCGILSVSNHELVTDKHAFVFGLDEDDCVWVRIRSMQIDYIDVVTLYADPQSTLEEMVERVMGELKCQLSTQSKFPNLHGYGTFVQGDA